MKKILAVALTLLMILSMTSMLAFNAADPQIKVSATYVIGDETVEATVSIDNTTDKAVAGLNVTLGFDTEVLEFDKAVKGSFTKNNGKSGFDNASLKVAVDNPSAFNITLADPEVGAFNNDDPDDVIDKRDLGKGAGDLVIVTFKIKADAAITECPFTLVGKDVGTDGKDVSIVDITPTAFTTSYTVVSPAADYTALNAAIVIADACVEANYKADSWTAFAAALAAAKAAKEFDVFKQSEINAAAANLVAKTGALEALVVSFTALDAAVADAGALTEASYTAASWKVLTDALAKVAAAKAITDYAKQNEIDAVTTGITAAIAALVEVDADYTALAAAIADAEALVEANYKADSWTTFAAALAAAKDFNAAEKVKISKQADVDAIVVSLTTAVNGLVWIPKALLVKTIEDAKAIDATKYEADEKWTAYQEAIAAAEAVLAREDATDEEYETAINTVLAAAGELNEVETSALSLTIIAVLALASLICAAFVISKKVRA